MPNPSGRHFLQIPGPSNVPDRVLRAMDMPTMDHRGPEFAQLTRAVLDGMKRVFKTAADVVIFPASGTGAWEAALVNTLSPGDRVLMFETGQFATLWRGIAVDLGLEVDFVEGDWRHGVDVTVGGSQKGLMLPPGLGFNAISAKALAAILLPGTEDADRLRQIILERYDMSLGTGLGKVQGKVFRIGHLGDFNDLTLIGTLGGVEMGLANAGIPFTRGGGDAALDYLANNH